MLRRLMGGIPKNNSPSLATGLLVYIAAISCHACLQPVQTHSRSDSIPSGWSLLWGKPSDKVKLCLAGSSKEKYDSSCNLGEYPAPKKIYARCCFEETITLDCCLEANKDYESHLHR